MLYPFSLPTKADKVPTGSNWLHEIKYDRYRMMLIRDQDRVRLISRGGHDWAKHFPLIVEAALKLRQEHFVIDGEVVVLDKDGISDFDALASRQHDKRTLAAFGLALVLPGHALTGPSTARRSRGSGRRGVRSRRFGRCLDALEDSAFVQNGPSDSSEFVGKRNREHVAMQPFLGCLDPRFEPIALPLLWPELNQHNPGGLYKQCAQVAIAAL
jgi:hypothetical protein